MAKKRVEQPDDEQDNIEYKLAAAEQDEIVLGNENVEPEVVEDESGGFFINDPEFVDALKDKVAATITKPGGAAVSLDTPNDERAYRVSFALPYGVLVALLDPEHADADVKAASAFGLIYLDDIDHADYFPTAIGTRVLAGFDQTAVRHKMTAAWREQHNRGVGGVK